MSSPIVQWRISGILVEGGETVFRFLMLCVIVLSIYCHKKQTTPYQVYLRIKLYIKLWMIRNDLM